MRTPLSISDAGVKPAAEPLPANPSQRRFRGMDTRNKKRAKNWLVFCCPIFFPDAILHDVRAQSRYGCAGISAACTTNRSVSRPAVQVDRVRIGELSGGGGAATAGMLPMKSAKRTAPEKLLV